MNWLSVVYYTFVTLYSCKRGMQAGATSPTEDANEHRRDEGPPPCEVRILHEAHDSMPEVEGYR